MVNNGRIYLVGGLEHGFYDVPFSWECHPNWRTPSFFRGVGWNHQPDYLHDTIDDFPIFSEYDEYLDVFWLGDFIKNRSWKMGENKQQRSLSSKALMNMSLVWTLSSSLADHLQDVIICFSDSKYPRGIKSATFHRV